MNRSQAFSAAFIAFVLQLLPCAAALGADDADLQFFESKVRPVLVERCFKCHSEKSEKLKGGLKLDSRAGMLKGGDNGPSIVPGEPAKSRLVEAINYHNVDLQMPPKGKLPDGQIGDLTAWVKRGAPWPAGEAGGGKPAGADSFDLRQRKADHWAWQPIKAHEPPAVKNASWPKDALDRFILAKLEEKGLEPAPPAEKRVLIRRAAFDLTGLPPTPEEVEAFDKDASPHAFAKVVDRLLDSPHFGERWGRHWLDLVRYAETRGHEFDYFMPDAFQYRDYVIRALNADVPYDRFVTEHIAGDLLRAPRKDPTGTVNESILGTGFWFLGEWVHSPVDIRQDEADRLDNQIDVMCKTFLGLTVACARCHDHKFDAISTKDYYGLAGFLNSSSYREVRFQHQEHNLGVVRSVRELDRRERLKVLSAFVESQPSSLERWGKDLGQAKADALHPLHPWALVAQEGAEPTGERIARLLNPVLEKWRAEAERAAKEEEQARASAVVDYASLRPREWITNGLAFGDGPVPAGWVALGQGRQEVAEAVAAINDRPVADSRAVSEKLPGMLRTPTFSVTSPRLTMRVRGSGQAFIVIDSHRTVEGPLHGVSKQQINAGNAWQDRTIDLSPYVGQRAHVEFTAKEGSFVAVAGVWQADRAPGRPRVNSLVLRALTTSPVISVEDLSARYHSLFAETANALAADRITADPDAGDRAQLVAWLYRPANNANESASQLEKAYREKRAALLASIKYSPTAIAMLDGNGVDERVFIRGSHKNQGDVVSRRFLEALAGDAQPKLDPACGSGRLELARRMTDVSTSPLLPRVQVNRVWHHLLGRGIVGSTDNFGVLGEKPSHPELLDYLSRRFVDEGWSTKQLIRELMLSSTYQMSSRPSERGSRDDPRNVLLHRANVRRLEAESIRDEMLALSGRLDRTMFGPGVEVHLTPFMDGRGKPTSSGPLDGDGRRSIYLRVRRNFLTPMLLAFDMPQPFNTMGRRATSNVPAQALILMNDPFVVEQAKLWAKRVLGDETLSTARERIVRMYGEAYGRAPLPGELGDATEFISRQALELGIEPERRATDPRVWADLAHVLMNVKEFIYVE
jgi:hypothetical protein